MIEGMCDNSLRRWIAREGQNLYSVGAA